MHILIVDDEQMALSDLKDTINEVNPCAEIECFDNYIDAVNAAEKVNFDVAFLDIAMPDRNGLELSKDLKDIYAGTNIIFVTGYSDHAVEAFAINASGYILKPAGKSAVQNALENLRIPIRYRDNTLRVQCFGNFKVFYGNERIDFKRSLTKECFAYLVNLKGAAANTNELCAVLFPNDSDSNKHYLRNLIADLRSTLRQYHSENVFICKRNSFSVDTTTFECDYYKFLAYDTAAINNYSGDYMKQYSWAEMTNGFLNSEIEKKH